MSTGMTKKKRGVSLKRPTSSGPTLRTNRPQTSSAVFPSRKADDSDSEHLQRAQGHHNKKHLRSKSLVLPSSNSVSNPSPVVRRFLRPSSTVSYTSTSYSHLKIIETEFTCKETADENHTSRFSLTPGDLVLRRGNSLILKMKTSLIVSCEYIVTLVFATAATMKRERFGEFRATGCAKETEELWLSIEIPSNFPIGKFQPHVTLTLKGLLEVFTHFHQGNIIILFNPLNPEDDSYLPYKEDVEDYFLSDKGEIWRGNSRQPVATPWEYGQYDEQCLDAALLLLSSLGPEECRSAALVSRWVTSRINACDNSGLMVSGYAGNLTCGIHPCRWTGSAPILQKYHKTRFPVKYGQCYVTAAVAVSVLRALGIAARPVTCYNCAVESISRGRVERYFSSGGDLVHNLCKDSVWVYHVWVEAWMRREDLPMGFDGWQVLDPTSTPKLSRQSRIGPAPVAAICNKLTSRTHPYNVDIVCDRITYKIHYLQIPSEACHTLSALKQASLVHIDHDSPPVMILTSNGNYEVPLDLTDYYFSSRLQDEEGEGSPSNMTQKKKKSQVKRTLMHHPVSDCAFEVLTSDNAMLGDTVDICVKITNRGGAIRQISGKVVGKVVKYTGAVTQNFMSMKFSGIINPGQNASVSLPIEPKKYFKQLTDQAMLQFFVIVTVKETQQVFIRLHDFRFLLPEVEILCPPSVTIGTTMRAKVRFQNPLQISLTRVNFLVQGKGLCSMRELPCKRTILPGSPAVVEFLVKASEAGKHWILVSLHCDQFTDVRGRREITVVAEKEAEPLIKSMDT